MTAEPAFVRVRDLLATFQPDGLLMVRSTSQGIGAELDAYALAVLTACSVPATRDEVIAAHGGPAGDLFDQLVDIGLLVPPDRALETPTMFGNFAGLDVHRAMLADLPRLSAYRRAIDAVVRPGDVVIDAGSGTGVLAVMAALAGASRVYAIERTEFARVIEQVAHDSGVGDRVRVVDGDFREVVLPEKARVLVTETFGAMVLAEGAQPDLRACVEANLEPDGVLIPYAFSLHLAPLHRAPSSLVRPFHRHPAGIDPDRHGSDTDPLRGIDLSCLAFEARGRSMNHVVPAADVGGAVTAGTWPLLCRPEEGLSASIDSLKGPAEALCGWFTLHLAEGVDLPTGPADPVTTWKQSVIPLELAEGDVVREVGLAFAPEDRRTLLMTLSGDGFSRELRVR